MKKAASKEVNQATVKNAPPPPKGGKAPTSSQSKPFNADDFVTLTLPRE